MHSFNFDTSLYWRGEDFDLTTTFGLNDTENISRRKMWGEEKRGVSSKFFNVKVNSGNFFAQYNYCLLYTSPSPRDKRQSRMPSSA